MPENKDGRLVAAENSSASLVGGGRGVSRNCCHARMALELVDTIGINDPARANRVLKLQNSYQGNHFSTK